MKTALTNPDSNWSIDSVLMIDLQTWLFTHRCSQTFWCPVNLGILTDREVLIPLVTFDHRISSYLRFSWNRVASLRGSRASLYSFSGLCAGSEIILVVTKLKERKDSIQNMLINSENFWTWLVVILWLFSLESWFVAWEIYLVKYSSLGF
jgi:hypothetical protein